MSATSVGAQRDYARRKDWVRGVPDRPSKLPGKKARRREQRARWRREKRTLALVNSPRMSAAGEIESRTGDESDLGRPRVHGDRRLCT